MKFLQSLDGIVGSLTREGNRKAKLTLLVLLLAELNLILHLITDQSWQTIAMAILAAYLVADVTEKKVMNGAAAAPPAAAIPLSAPIEPMATP